METVGWSLALVSLPFWLLLNEETHISFSFKLGQSWPRHSLSHRGMPSCPRLLLSLVFLPLLHPWQAWQGLPKVVTFT